MNEIRVSASLGMDSGIVFERHTHFAVGNQAVTAMTILDVVDIWGNANQYYEVCFPKYGAVVFLDASTSPRTVMRLDSYQRDGYSCGAMTRGGTMVLVQAEGGSSGGSSGSSSGGGANQPGADRRYQRPNQQRD